MSTLRFDTSELNRHAADLSRAPNRIQRNAPKVFEVAANKIKKGMRRDASGHDYLPRLGVTVNYDRFGDMDYEIGFDKVGQGNLANIAAFGSINNAPILDLNAPLRREVPFMLRHLAGVGEESVLGSSG